MPCATDVRAPWSSRSPPTSQRPSSHSAELHYLPPKRHPSTPSAADVRDAVTALLGASKPVIWSGMGVLMSGASAALTALAELAENPGVLHDAGQVRLRRAPSPRARRRQRLDHAAGAHVAPAVGRAAGAGLQPLAHGLRSAESPITR